MVEVVSKGVPEKYKLSVQDVERMVDASILPEDARLELIDGDIVRMTPVGKKRALTVTYLSNVLAATFGPEYLVYVQNPLELSPYSAPEPDIAIIEGPAQRYKDRLPRAEDVKLLIEVSNSSLKYDRTVKLPLYAGAGIPEVWLVNLQEDVLEVYRQPKGARYRQMLVLLPDETVAPEAFSDAPIEWRV